MRELMQLHPSSPTVSSAKDPTPRPKKSWETPKMPLLSSKQVQWCWEASMPNLITNCWFQKTARLASITWTSRRMSMKRRRRVSSMRRTCSWEKSRVSNWIVSRRWCRLPQKFRNSIIIHSGTYLTNLLYFNLGTVWASIRITPLPNPI